MTLTVLALSIFLSGQSNAVYLAPVLKPDAVVAQMGAGIGHWINDFPDSLWPATEKALTGQKFDAIVWWQGESDRHATNYLYELRSLIHRMRRTAGNPRLKIVIVRVLDRPENTLVRRAQEQFVRTDPNAVLISSDGFRLAQSDHLTERGYRVVAERIRRALR